MTSVSFSQHNLTVTREGEKDRTDFVYVPITRDGLECLQTFLERFLEKNPTKDYSQPYKLLDEFTDRLDQVQKCTTRTPSTPFTIDDAKGRV